MTEQREFQSPSSEFSPEIRRARFYQLTIYEISETELEILERGSPDSIFLNFSVFLLSTAIAFTISLLTTIIISTRLFNILVIVTSIGYVIGAILLILWARNRRSVSNCGETIRNRLPPEGVQQEFDQVDVEQV